MTAMMITRDEIHQSRYLAGQVKRYHTWPTIRQPNVAEHSHRMAGIYVEMFGLPRAEVLMWIHDHDLGEQYAGDVPYGAKHRVPGLQDAINRSEELGREILKLPTYQLTEVEFGCCKIVDLMEMWEFAMCEYNMGNRYARPIILSCLEAAYNMAVKVSVTDSYNNWLRAQPRRFP